MRKIAGISKGANVFHSPFAGIFQKRTTFFRSWVFTIGIIIGTRPVADTGMEMI